MDRREIIEKIRAAAAHFGTRRLKKKDFLAFSGITMRQLLQHVDTYREACNEAGIDCGTFGRENLKSRRAITQEECIAELQRVAGVLNKETLSQREFRGNSALVHPATVARCFGRHDGPRRAWDMALAAARLQPDPQYKSSIPLAHLASDFLAAATELNRVPNLHQVTRWSRHVEHCFSAKFGGYPNFEYAAIEFLLGSSARVPTSLRPILQAEFERLTKARRKREPAAIGPHHHGRGLGFRAFAFEPTYENEVIGLFGAVADELGFEIRCQRAVFPDCEAGRRIPGRRMRYKKCLIEFEVASRDYKAHNHPMNGCDLIVCWEHNWPDCPIEVLELRTAIRGLPGWR